MTIQAKQLSIGVRKALCDHYDCENSDAELQKELDLREPREIWHDYLNAEGILGSYQYLLWDLAKTLQGEPINVR